MCLYSLFWLVCIIFLSFLKGLSVRSCLIAIFLLCVLMLVPSSAVYAAPAISNLQYSLSGYDVTLTWDYIDSPPELVQWRFVREDAPSYSTSIVAYADSAVRTWSNTVSAPGTYRYWVEAVRADGSFITWDYVLVTVPQYVAVTPVPTPVSTAVPPSSDQVLTDIRDYQRSNLVWSVFAGALGVGVLVLVFLRVRT